jgi:hypothetical protein
MERIERLHATNFGVSEEPMTYKGEMVREGGPWNRVYPPNATAPAASRAVDAAHPAGRA